MRKKRIERVQEMNKSGMRGRMVKEADGFKNLPDMETMKGRKDWMGKER